MKDRFTRVLLCLLLLSLASTGQADSQQSAEFMLAELDSINQFSTLGRTLYATDDKQLSGGDYCSVSLQFAEAGEFRRALREASKTIYLGQKNDKSYVTAIGARNLALAYNYANDIANAERFAQQVLDADLSSRLNVVGPAYKVLGDVRLRQGRYADAADFYQQSVDNSPTWMEPMIVASLARARALNGEYDKAEKLYVAATETAADLPENDRTDRLIGTFGKIGDWFKPAIIRGQAELAFLRGDHDKAIALYESIKISSEADPYQAVWLHAGKARALWAKGDKESALASIERAIATTESLRAKFRSEEIKVGLFGNVQDVFDDAIEMAMQQGQHARALHLSEKSRARALLDMVRNRVTFSDGSDAFADPLRAITGLDQIQAALSKDKTLVVYHSTTKQTFAFVITQKNLKAVTIPLGRDPLANKVRQLQNQIRGQGETDLLLRELYTALIDPLGLGNAGSVIIAAHKALHFLPFQALRGPDGYLVEAHALQQVPSASILTLTHAPADQGAHLLALGNPKLASPQYDLPGAQAEVESIAKLYSAPKVYVRENATRSKVLNEGPASNVIHIAAHAEVDEADPLYSRILLAQGGFDPLKKDLEAKDIYSIDLHNTGLVVLSACQSGLGKISGGDELFGFTRTFLSAGADRVMVSLWDVEDNATAALMKKFYSAAQKTDMPIALQQAQVSLLKDSKTSHPLFWAGFNLVGVN